ncbi:hypothetical protein [Microbacterium thalassium]|uniref:Uncharacterized protein n=1 Tax=Microbacterium thalassium TaxID=362649 RepID=A0A7X0FSE2_9MICO|nr:hypothetical protein [Microbacterium thalassium]MBB6392855.1 hypothetical protein [Microbacterium thalassium]GLK22914.1 hypothetical protein GCM10017607_02320 [Microbacterium thalassium]
MTSETAPTRRRPVAVTVAVVLIYLSGLLATAIGILILLSRYDVPESEVLTVSLLGSAVILFGLLTVSAGASIARGSALARLLVTIYLGLQLVLHAVTIVATSDWDWAGFVQPALMIFILVVLWLPPMARYFVRGPATAAS